MTGITNPTEEYFKDGLWGWDGTRWRKAGVPLWYRSSYFEDLGGTATGTYWDKHSTAVPAGYVYVVSALSLRNEARASGRTEFLLYNDAGQCIHLAWSTSLAQYQPLIWAGNAILSEGWKIRVTMATIQSGDEISGGLAGYKVAIA